MKSLFKFKRSPKPFLAPLGPQPRFPRLSRETFDRLPPAAAPVAVTLVGGLALVVILGMFLGREAATSRTGQAASVSAEQVAALPEPAAQPEPEPAALVAMEPAVAEPAPEVERPGIGEVAVPVPDAPAFKPDPERTASILSALSDVGAFLPTVPVAETDEELAALEAIQRREVEADVGAPSDEATASIAPAETGPMRPATATRYVNMRAGPDDDAEVLLVVPALARIEAGTDCNWCIVSYEGRSGYIYRTFISYE